MKSISVYFPENQSVKDFVNTVSAYPYEVDLHSGRYIVDAKSMLGIFSLDLSIPVVCEIHSDNCDDLLKALAKFTKK